VDEQTRTHHVVARHAIALVAYVCVLGVLIGFPLIGGHGRFLSNSPADGSIFLWALGWWPQALVHGDLLPYTHVLFAPAGTNLAWTTSLPVPGLFLAPVTALFGPVATFNLLAVLAPVTAAWATYLVVHRLTCRWWPAFLSGLLFALSPLEMREVAIGHLNLTLVAMIPLAVYLIVCRLQGSLRAVPFITALGAVMAVQIGISTEVFLTMVSVGALTLALIAAFDRDRRRAIAGLATLMLGALATAAVLASPLLYAALVYAHPAGVLSSTNMPTPISGTRTLIGSPGTALTAPAGSRSTSGTIAAIALGAFVVMACAINATLLWSRRRSRTAWALAVTAATVLMCYPGTVSIGTTALPSPWGLVQRLPLFGLVRPQRLTIYVWLLAAVVAGLWVAARPRSTARLLAVGVMIAAAIPGVVLGPRTSVIRAEPPLAQAGISSEVNIFVVAGPSGSAGARAADLAFPAVWQAESGFRFRLADAYVGSFHPALPAAVGRFADGVVPAGRGDAGILEWLRRSGVRAVMVMHPSEALDTSIQRLLGTAGTRVGTVELFSELGVLQASQ
jgi:hypothetical protein